ncbi:hypothetical protein ABZ725_14445 [Streptomyces sp. NPDC006872]|uniref:hypothetical protein n=1 Tax=Streptomyces sp. NPDC006872 TaxID=3155720 RepID=UPI0034116F34
MAVAVKESADDHAFDADRATENRNVPELDAVQIERWVIVSEVPPFVHDGFVPVSASADPDDDAANVNTDLLDDPALMAVVPAAPGFAVWSWA